MGTLFSRFRRCRSGAAAVEFSMVGLLFIMLAIGIIETGRALHLRNHMAHAIDVAARKLIVDPTTTNSALETAMRDAFTEGDAAALTISFQDEVVDGVSCRRVVVDYPLTLDFAGMAAQAITMTVERRIPLS